MNKLIIYTIVVFSLGCYVGGGRIPMGLEFLIAYVVAFLTGVKVTLWGYRWKANDFTLFGRKLRLSFAKPVVENRHEKISKPRRSSETPKCAICNGEDVTLNGQVIPCPACKFEIVEEDGKVVPIKKKRKVQ